VTAKARNGMSFIGDASVGCAGKTKANIKVKGTHGDLTIDKLTIGTEKKLEGELKFANIFPHAQASFKFTDGSRDSGAETTAEIGLKVTSDVLGVVDVEADPLRGPTFTVSFVKEISSVFFGAKAKLAATAWGVESHGDSESKASEGKKTAATAFTAGGVTASLSGLLLGYKANDFTLYAQTCGHSGYDHLHVGLLHNASSSLTTGVCVYVKPEDGPKIVFGGSYTVDDRTTVSATANQDALVSVAYKKKINPSATVTLNGQVDAPKLSSGSHKFGLTLALTN